LDVVLHGSIVTRGIAGWKHCVSVRRRRAANGWHRAVTSVTHHAMPRLTFEVSIPPDETRQRVVVVGTDPALGNWQPERGLELERGGDGRFRGACDLPYGLVEFKITRGSWETEESWADGAPVFNYQHLMAHDLDLSIEVEHWKDAQPVDHELIYGKAIDAELDATQLGQHRRVTVWLPPGFLRDDASRHPVLYLFDGQDALAALGSPENETLGADDWARRLARSGVIPELVLVAIFHREEFGHRDAELSPQCDGPKLADFVVHDLKPFIDYTLCRDRTLIEPKHTGVAGFGLGGSLALWMAARHGGTFGRFGCLSPYYEDLSGDKPAECELVREIKSAKGFRPGGKRIYFDHGTLGGDAAIANYQARVTDALIAKKFAEGRDFTVNVALGAEHSITAWRARFGAALEFLFGK
jgi:enterochelin esterase-like enzyme